MPFSRRPYVALSMAALLAGSLAAGAEKLAESGVDASQPHTIGYGDQKLIAAPEVVARREQSERGVLSPLLHDEFGSPCSSIDAKSARVVFGPSENLPIELVQAWDEAGDTQYLLQREHEGSVIGCFESEAHVLTDRMFCRNVHGHWFLGTSWAAGNSGHLVRIHRLPVVQSKSQPPLLTEIYRRFLENLIPLSMSCENGRFRVVAPLDEGDPGPTRTEWVKLVPADPDVR